MILMGTIRKWHVKASLRGSLELQETESFHCNCQFTFMGTRLVSNLLNLKCI
jgi:hypothetical protein